MSKVVSLAARRPQTWVGAADLHALTRVPRGTRRVRVPELLLYSPHHTDLDVALYALIEDMSAAYGYCDASREFLAGRLDVSVSAIRNSLARLEREHVDQFDADNPWCAQPAWLVAARHGPRLTRRQVLTAPRYAEVPAWTLGERGETPVVSLAAWRVYAALRLSVRHHDSSGIVRAPMGVLAKRLGMRAPSAGVKRPGIGAHMAELVDAGLLVRHLVTGGTWAMVPLGREISDAEQREVELALALEKPRLRRAGPVGTPPPKVPVTPPPKVPAVRENPRFENPVRKIPPWQRDVEPAKRDENGRLINSEYLAARERAMQARRARAQVAS